jgi:outer membrane lipoprotein-sorting protein
MKLQASNPKCIAAPKPGLAPWCLVFVWFLVLGVGCFASRAADTNTVLNAWLAAQTNLHTWTADLTQTRTLKTLTQPLTATGHLWFGTPNRFRWELGSPARTIAVRNADEMFVIYPRLKRAEKYPLGGNVSGEWRDMLSLLDAGFPRNRADLDSRFQVLSLAETNGAWQLTLQPRSAFARKMMAEIRVGLATNDFLLTSTELVFVDGSCMRNDFTNSVLNPAFDEKIFNWTPDPDFKVTEPLAK